jgi:ElaB/YqjD/DUF883 family membrane-anchored ribosome-binding protein
MFRHAPYTRAIAADMAEIERRLRSLEKRLEQSGGAVSAQASQAVDRAGELIAGVLGDWSDRFRSGARSIGDDAVKQAAQLSRGAARLGNDALRRVADEIERRPLTALAVVAGIGILLGLAGRRR